MTKQHSVTPEQAVEVLNRIHAADPTVMPALIAVRVACNEAVGDDPTVQVMRRKSEGNTYKDEVGFLGVLNGIFGVKEDGWGYIAAYYKDDDDPMSLTHFGVLED